MSSDSLWPSVVLLCPFEGNNGDTNAINLGKRTRTESWYTAPSLLTTAQKPYGNTSLPCVANRGLYFSPPSNPSPDDTWCPRLSDFTFDGYFYPTADAAGNNTLFSIRPGNGMSGGVTDFIDVQHHSSYRIGMQLYGTAHSETTDSANNALVVNTWQHVALVRSAGVTKLYVGGVQVCTHADTNNYGAGGAEYTARFAIGASGYDGSYAFIGYLKDMRYTLAARWTGPFTPPTGPFPSSATEPGATPGHFARGLPIDDTTGKVGTVSSPGLVLGKNGKLIEAASGEMAIDGLGAFISAVNGFTFTAAGALRMNAFAVSLPAGVYYQNGFPFTADGQLCVDNTNAVARVVGGVPFTSIGAVAVS